METSEEKKLRNICVKLTKVFTDFYILKTGHLISLDIEKPFMVELNDKQLDLFYKATEVSDIIHIKDLKEFKKDYSTGWEIPELRSEITHVKSVYAKKMDHLLKINDWIKFRLFPNDELHNETIMDELFKDNIYVEFTPEDTENSPPIIITKSLLPLVSEKNYNDVYYSSIQLLDDLFILIFDFHFDLFPIYSFNYYIPIKKENE